MMRVEMISKENIKPSSPTPEHLKTFRLSLLDQLTPIPFTPIVVFYPNNDASLHVQQRLLLLKQSLSQTLTRFYPLAGIIQNDLCILCNDQGAYFSVAKVNVNLFQFLNNADIHLLDRFLPCEPSYKESSSGDHVTNIQVNLFECGGIGIGLSISHKILDGSGLKTFLKAWSGTACGSEEVVYPDFVASSLMFPTDELWLKDSSRLMWGSLIKKGKCTTRRFVFDASAIATLKTKASGLQQPTRIEVVSAFIWRCAMAASEKKHGAKRSSLLTHMVNLRKRITPTLSDESLGNLIWISCAKCNELGFPGLVEEVRKSISKINVEFVKKMRGDQGAAVMCKSLKKIGNFGSKEDVDYYGFTSWCKLGFYEADFGWGKPVWVTSVGASGEVFINFTILMDTKCGQGIEAWVTLDEQEMNILEHDNDFLALASLDPSPVKF